MTELSAYKLAKLREGEFTLYRGVGNGLASILLVAPAGEYPSSDSLQHLEHEYRLRTDLDADWAARPVRLMPREARPILVLEDPGGEPLERLLGRPLGLLFTGSAVGLVYAYLVRFIAVSLQTVEASLTRIAPNLDDAARALGVGARGALRRVHLPLLRGGLATALVLVFVETMKEMPATLLLRPFGLDTLAIEVWQRTSEAMWQEAAVPALAIVLAGLGPVLLVIRWSRRLEPHRDER